MIARLIPRLIFVLLLLAIGGSLPVRAADLDGSAPIYCAFTRSLECQAKTGCDTVLPEEVSLPSFIRIDFQKNIVTSMEEGEKSLTTQIKSFQRQDANLTLQGAEKRAWSLVIARKTGKMTLAVAGEDDGFVVFGSCVAP